MKLFEETIGLIIGGLVVGGAALALALLVTFGLHAYKALYQYRDGE